MLALACYFLGNDEDLSDEDKQDAMFFINKAENGMHSLV